MRVCVIFNPTARGDKAWRFREALGTWASDCALMPTPAPGAATTLAIASVRDGYDTIVAAGGDGTVSEVVAGMAAAPGGLQQARLGVIPLGTMNVFARELGLPLRAGDAWRALRHGQDRRIDLPWVESGSGSERKRRPFAQLAGAGLDSRAIAMVDWGWKRRLGPLAYVQAGLKALRGSQPPLHVRTDQRLYHGELVLIGNGSRYGGETPMFPGARMTDGLLDVRVFPRANVGLILRFGWSWLLRRPMAQTSATSFQAACFEVTSEIEVPVEVDGDNVGFLPARFGVDPGALRVLVPAP